MQRPCRRRKQQEARSSASIEAVNAGCSGSALNEVDWVVSKVRGLTCLWNVQKANAIEIDSKGNREAAAEVMLMVC